MGLIVFLSICLMIALPLEAQESCYANNSNPYLNFGTKTAYEHAYNKRGITPVPDCKAVQLWLVSRHGTRWPDEGEMADFQELNQIRNHIVSNYNANKGSLCMKDIENLKSWQFSGTPETADLLTEQGKQDLFWLGRRVFSYFPELFNTVTYSSEKFIFRHTDTPRTKESAEYFAKGLLGLNLQDPSPPLPEALKDDRLIYPYNNCPAWKTKSEANKQERNKFYNGEYMSRVIFNVSQRLGFDYNLTQENVRNIYNGCRYQKAWDVSSTSPWCAAFSKDDLEILEYSEDLKYYYKSGPGTPMNLQLSCSLAKDLIDRFTEVENSPDSQHPLGAFYFSHASMIDMISSRLELFGDSLPPTADNFMEQRNRQFRTSHIIPFTGNVLAVLYKCNRGDPFQTIFYQAEDIVRYPGCSVGLCGWNYIKQRFATIVEDPSCTNDKYCFEKSGSTIHYSTTYALLVAGILFCLTLRL